jgi:phospholipid transport system substrate-binding protein
MAVLKLMIVLCALFCTLPAISAKAGPEAPVAQLNDALLQAMQGGERLGLPGRYRLLAPVMDEVFALPLMARTAAGRFWREMDPAQKKSYLEKYREWTITSYASRFDDYRGQTFTIPENPKPANRTMDVIAVFTKTNGERISFEYKVVRAVGRWQIADVRIRGVSQLALTRTQFVDILAKKGVTGLLAQLEEKIANMTAGGESDLNSGNGS